MSKVLRTMFNCDLCGKILDAGSENDVISPGERFENLGWLNLHITSNGKTKWLGDICDECSDKLVKWIETVDEDARIFKS